MNKGTRKKLKNLHVLFIIGIGILFIIATFSPFTRIWNRNDIWIGIMPLSEFMIFLLGIMMAILLAVHYFIERSILRQGADNDK